MEVTLYYNQFVEQTTSSDVFNFITLKGFSGNTNIAAASIVVKLPFALCLLTTLIKFCSYDHLTLTYQKRSMTAITNVVIQSLNVSTEDCGALAFTHTDANECTELTVSGFDTVLIGANGAPTYLVTITTAGTIKSFTAVDNDDLKSLNIGHTYSFEHTDAQFISVTNHDELKSVDLATVVRLESANIAGNVKLATIMAPAITDLLTVGATLSYTINSNLVSVT